MASTHDSYSKGRVKLYHGDCIDVLKRLRVRANAVITDPPYESHMHVSKMTARGVRTDGYASPKPVKFKSIDGVREVIMPLLVPKCTGWFIAFCTPEGIAPWRDQIEAAGARYKRACFFIKPDSAPQFNGQGPAFAVEPFVTAWCGSGVSKWNGGGRRNYFIYPTNNPERQGDHPTEKPLALMMEIIELFTNPDDLILDPFMGSGSTVLAAMATGRRVIGIENDARTYALAKGRVEAFRMGRAEGRAHIAKMIHGNTSPGPLFDPVAPSAAVA